MPVHDLAFERPPVFVREADYDRLLALAGSSNSPGAALLRRELERADIVANDARSDYVRLNSRVDFIDLVTGRNRRMVLVGPEEADVDEDRLSVVSPAGAALLGLRAGDTFGWADPDGRPHVLLVSRVAHS
jgi:regulator of nucleoside diphosphate kinase